MATMPCTTLASGLYVSKLCLGTMTYGEQNSFEDACQQLNMAREEGVNFFDAAYMYPVPQKAETQGRTEECAGRWDSLYMRIFGDIDYDHSCGYSSIPIEEQSEALSVAVEEGKECWREQRRLEFCRLAEQKSSLCRICTIQNICNLLCRTFDMTLAECYHYQRVGLLAYSPLAMGLHTGIYFCSNGEPFQYRLNKY